MTQLRRVEELLASKVTEGLDAGEVRELERLIASEPGWREEEFELAAAALDLALVRDEEEMPATVRDRLKASLLARVGDQPNDETDVVVELASRRTARSTSPGPLPWLAAAAALVIALIGWWPRLSGAPAAETVRTPQAAPTVAELRQSLSAREGTLAREWTATEDPASADGVSGDVVWNGAEQRGYMRFRGLAANEPTREQYQLWIFDKGRDERFPVDGGVFDIPAGTEEVLVPIDPKLEVGEPYLFAVTVEPPGGVVVSSRERIAVVAEV